MYIQEREIQRILRDEKEYRYARFLDIRQILERMTISKDNNNGCLRVNARINDHEQRYIVSLKISSQGEILDASCSCHISGCRHIGAILFFLSRFEINTYPYVYEQDKTIDKTKRLKELEKQRQQRILNKKEQEVLNLIDIYKDQSLRESLSPLSTKQYRIRVFVSYRKEGLFIGLKVYNDMQGYVVKNLDTFFHAIEHYESIKYGKNFEFIHSYDAFDDDSLEILQLLKVIMDKNKLIQKGVIRGLLVTDKHIDEFYDCMSQLPSQYCDIAFDLREYQLPLDIQPKDDYYIIDFKEYSLFENTLRSSDYIYAFENDTLYRYDFQNSQKMFLFIEKAMESRGGLYVPKNSLNDFYKYILIDILDDISIDTQYFHEYHQENMINLYGDMTSDDQICLQIEYIYDDGVKYAFDEDNIHKSKETDLIENYLRPYIEDIDDHVIYLLYDHDFAYQFMRDGLSYLSKYCHIYVSDNLKTITQKQSMHLQIGISVSNGLLSVNIESLDFNKEELYDVLKAFKKKRKFYKLTNGQIISLENRELKELDELTSSLQLKPQDFQKDNIDIPSYRLFELDQLVSQDSSIQYSRSDEFNQWIDHLKDYQKDFEVPSHYQNILRGYQVEGYRWLRIMQMYGFGGILADDMGLGKTLQIIVYLESMQGEGVHLVVTPASLLLNWQDEIEKFSSNLKVLCVYGHKQQRDELFQHVQDYDVVLISYDYLRRDIELYSQFAFHTVILDEAQYIKNPKTQNALCVKRLQSKQRFALTGTPIENSLAELWSIFDFLMPHYLYNYSYFLENYERPIVKDKDNDKQEKLRQMITPFVLRRNKKDVLKELPEKIEQTFYFHMNEEEEKLYLGNLVQVNKSLQQKLDMHQLGHIDILAMLTRLRQLCQDPRLLYEDIEQPSSKLKGCMELIHSLQESGKKILLFSSFTSVLHLIEEQCVKEHVSYYLLDGSVPKEKRKAMVDAFQKDETTLFLISLKAGGSGLNLTSAQAVIHYDPWWNMSAKNQATDRAHRMGQKNTVQVFSLIMKGTIEEKIMDLQKQKKNLADTFVEGHDGSISSMSVDDLKTLFEY